MKKSLSAILALGLCAGLSGCSTTRHKDVVPPVNNLVEPVTVYYDTPQGSRDYLLPGGEADKIRLTNFAFQMQLAEGSLGKDRYSFSFTEDISSSPEAIYLLGSWAGKDLVADSEELTKGLEKGYKTLDEVKKTTEQIIKINVSNARNETNSFYKGTNINRVDLNGSMFQ